MSRTAPREDIILLEADRHRVVQVVTNLLSNAVKFTKGHGDTVSISTKRKKEMTVIT